MKADRWFDIVFLAHVIVEKEIKAKRRRKKKKKKKKAGKLDLLCACSSKYRHGTKVCLPLALP